MVEKTFEERLNYLEARIAEFEKALKRIEAIAANAFNMAKKANNIALYSMHN